MVVGEERSIFSGPPTTLFKVEQLLLYCFCFISLYVLEVDVFSGLHDQSFGGEVVLDCGIDLHDVAPLPPHVNVVYGCISHLGRAWKYEKPVAPETNMNT